MMHIFYEAGFWILVSGFMYGVFFIGTLIYEKYFDKDDNTEAKK